LCVGKETANLPDDFVERKGERNNNYTSALILPTRCYVAHHNQFGFRYPLVCIDRSPLKERWKSVVWGSLFGGGATGAHRQVLEIVEEGDRVVVFGIAATGFHVEAFRVNDGTNIFRFSNSYLRYFK
jgi:hypothetical protein